METTYELWDVDTGNAIGSFATEDEGLEVVRTLLAAYGRGYVADLSLSRRQGTEPAQIVAIGEQLAQLSERPSRPRATAPAAS